MVYSMKTDKGVVRDANQDNCSMTVLDEKSCFAVVCDGMGGPNAGDIASSMAVSIITENFVAGWNNNISLDSVKELLVEAINAANSKIFIKSREVKQYEGMGTTVVAAVCMDDALIIANVGDSRAYFVSDKLQKITKDHSYLQELLDNGKISEKEAENFPYKNVITRALGTKATVVTDIFQKDALSEGESILLCSDGLFNYACDEEILSAIKNTDYESIASALVAIANKNGGGDNITALVFSK